jgi:hypothetical protein
MARNRHKGPLPCRVLSVPPYRHPITWPHTASAGRNLAKSMNASFDKCPFCGAPAPRSNRVFRVPAIVHNMPPAAIEPLPPLRHPNCYVLEAAALRARVAELEQSESRWRKQDDNQRALIQRLQGNALSRTEREATGLKAIREAQKALAPYCGDEIYDAEARNALAALNEAFGPAELTDADSVAA